MSLFARPSSIRSWANTLQALQKNENLRLAARLVKRRKLLIIVISFNFTLANATTPRFRAEISGSSAMMVWLVYNASIEDWYSYVGVIRRQVFSLGK
jgi:hypothetical protein